MLFYIFNVILMLYLYIYGFNELVKETYTNAF